MRTNRCPYCAPFCMRKFMSLAANILAACTLTIPAKATDSAPPVRVVVLAFENSTGLDKFEPLKNGLRDLIMVDLAKVEGVAVVEREDLEKIAKEQTRALRGIMDEKARLKIGRLLGANRILAGGFALVDSTLQINAHLLDVETSRLIGSAKISGPANRIVELERDLVLKLFKNFDNGTRSLPPDKIDTAPQANLHFMRGLGHYYGCMYDDAIMEFMNALSLEPKHADARFWNGKSYFARKAYAHAKVEFERFMEEFPKDPRIGEARNRLAKCSENMEDWQKNRYAPAATNQ